MEPLKKCGCDAELHALATSVDDEHSTGDPCTVWGHLLQSGDVCGVQNVPQGLMDRGLAKGTIY